MKRISLNTTANAATIGAVLVIIMLIGGTSTLPVAAQTPPGHDDATSASTELLMAGDDIVTTVTRSPQRVSDSPEAVTVITADDIMASGAKNIPDLLRSLPGVDVSAPNQSQQNVAIRGYNNVYSNTVLVMVDGRRINEDFNESVFWVTNPILLTRIKRIEVVRGPGSVLYGADAFSGVINIILKTPAENAADDKKGKFIGQYEAHSTEFAEGTYTGVSKDKQLAATLGVGYHGVTGQFQSEPGKVQDSSSIPVYTLDVERRTSRGSLILSAGSADGKADLTTDLEVPDGAFNTNTLSVSYNEDRGANPVTARVYENLMRLSGGNVYNKSQAVEFDIQQERTITSRNRMTYGATYRDTKVISGTTGPDSHSEHLASLFLQDQQRLSSRTTLFAGVRDDNHSLYGTQVSSRFSLVNQLAANRSLRLSYGNAYTAPSFVENYLDYSGPLLPGVNVSYVPNLKLKPEKISTIEAGYRVELPKGFAGASVYYNDINGLITGLPISYFPAPFPPGIPSAIDFQNVGDTHSEGLELEASYKVSSLWSVLPNYSYEDCRSNNRTTEDLAPHNKFNLVVLSDPMRRWSSYFAGHFVSAETSDNQNLTPYTTLDARVAYRLGRSQSSWTASLAATDLFDDRHFEYLDLNGSTPGAATAAPTSRTIRIELSGSF